MLTQDNFNKAKLVEIGWRFSATYNAGHVGGQMIMHVIANRVRCGWGNGGWLGIMERVPLYMAEGEMPPLNYPPTWNPDFVKLLQAVDGVFDGSILDTSKGALYWGLLGKIERAWFKINVIDAVDPVSGLRRHPRVADFNSLSFWA